MQSRMPTQTNDPTPTGAGDRIRPVPRTGTLRLSPGQERLWFLDGLHGGGTEYLSWLRMRLHGPWDPAVFARAVTEVVRRHEVLRTRYQETAGDPVQVVDPPGPADVTVVDLTGEPDSEARAMGLLDAAASRPFDLRREHPLRVVVARLAPAEHLVAVTLHHIAADAWSCDVLLRDLDQAYRALVAGRPGPAPPPVQYADVAAWQQARRRAAGTAGTAYWREQLAGLEPVVLPTDRPRGARRDPGGDILTMAVPRHVARLVDTTGERYGTTAFMTLLAAFQVLLAHCSGRTDVAVGAPAEGRNEPETEDLIGFFVNTLVLRTDLAGEPPFTEVLNRVRETVLTALMHNDVPFEDVVAAVQPRRDPARNPLFEIMFQVLHTAGTPDTLGGAVVEPLPAIATAAKFDLVFTVRRTAAGDLECVLEYASGLFDRATMRRLADDYVALLERLTGEPQAPAVRLTGEPQAPAVRLTGEPEASAVRLEPAPPAAPTTSANPRAAVPTPTTSAPSRPTAVPTPLAGRVEQVVAGIWSRLLGIDDIAADDDFFDLGGHSLLVARVRTALRQAFAVDLPLQVLFEATSVAELATVVTAAVRADVSRLSDSQVQDLLSRAAREGTR